MNFHFESVKMYESKWVDVINILLFQNYSILHKTDGIF